ncbi:TetR family transcriptional regulator [Paractinoplanes abujensis]|uniref:AcrR family transcriptional regulator n=1 Tax=Paractinoplanes abujensis TaxID=882441 RepID=A0A7W7D2D2_9ACTN|nr:TetR/AcrR family transcriptional regulator [Actinoplanes abujensis]MBB4698030.1 AcrR family transcriptional regulator [Actinoplanes abujensis]GID19486.1 TetR family transcriptional regulator [Actinoplanes abujensis]
MPSRRTQAERSAGTTAELLTRATAAFGSAGFDRVKLDAVAEAAGLTKGAVYHHFGGKHELFLAVYAAAHERIAARTVAAVTTAGDAWGKLEAGVAEFLTAVAEPELQRIVVVDGPRVLDRATIRDVEDRHTAGLLRSAFTRLREAGELSAGDDDLRTRLVLGAVCEAAATIAESATPEQTLAAARTDVGRLLSGLRA